MLLIADASKFLVEHSWSQVLLAHTLYIRLQTLLYQDHVQDETSVSQCAWVPGYTRANAPSCGWALVLAGFYRFMPTTIGLCLVQ